MSAPRTDGRSRFDAVIFDMDGLLLDSERIALAAFVQTCEQFGLGDQHALFVRCVGITTTLGEDVLREGLEGKADHVEFGRTWDTRYAEALAAGPAPLKSGATEFLEALREARIPCAVATSTSSSRARGKLLHAGILDRFAAVVGGDQVARSKPEPHVFLAAAMALNARPEQCLALEDSENGVRAALAAGMTVIQIPDLVPPSPALRALGHAILASLHDARTYAFDPSAEHGHTSSRGDSHRR